MNGIAGENVAPGLRVHQLAFILIMGLLLTTSPTHGEGGSLGRGYLYLSPLPGAEYCPTQTRFVLVRFVDLAPSDVTNLLTSFITVAGNHSGVHSGNTHIAADGRTVIFAMTNDFAAEELVTVALNPQLRPGASGSAVPFQYRFAVSTHFPDPGTITARGEVPPAGAKESAFDATAGTKWVDPVVPDGTANFSWIQYLYPGDETRVINQYALTAAADAPQNDPRDWRFYGVDGSDNLILLDSRTDETFSARGERKIYAITNAIGYRGFRLEITQVNSPASANAVQLDELEFMEPGGTLLREVWLDVPGLGLSDLTNNVNYPDHPSFSDRIWTFQTPTDWADNYGTRVHGYITAPATGDFVFWIASDDFGELHLSTNEDPANRRRIAYVPGWATPCNWDAYAQQKSAPVQLVAGQKYYVEALQKERAGGDNLAVGWAKPGEDASEPSEIIPGSVLSPWVGAAAAPSSPRFVSVRSRDSRPSASSGNGRISFGPGPALNSAAAPGRAGLMPNGVSVPSDFPHVSISVSNNPDPEPIFLDNRGAAASLG